MAQLVKSLCGCVARILLNRGVHRTLCQVLLLTGQTRVRQCMRVRANSGNVTIIAL